MTQQTMASANKQHWECNRHRRVVSDNNTAVASKMPRQMAEQHIPSNNLTISVDPTSRKPPQQCSKNERTVLKIEGLYRKNISFHY